MVGSMCKPPNRLFHGPTWIAAASFGICLVWPYSAAAYRPFDGTDAAVADVGEVEIEFQPAGVLREGPQTTLIGPWSVLDYGFSKDWEAVVEARLETPISPSGPSRVTATSAFPKHVLRPGR